MKFRILWLALVVSASATACLSPPPAPEYNPVIVTTTFPPRPPALQSTAEGYPQLGGTAPGSLISATEFDAIDPRITDIGATASRVRYMSTSAIDGQPVETTGLVLIPGGAPPAGGWQVIAYDHDNTGIASNCGPSLYENLLDPWSSDWAWLLLLHGFAVVMADYEGLGGSGTHPFLNAAALGRNVIDVVRAARHLRPDIGSRWATFGGSLGGLAAWAANEQASTYGAGDLELVGAVSWAPLVDVSELPGRAKAGTLTRDQIPLYFEAIMGLKRTTHPEINLEDYIHGDLYENRDLLMVCVGHRVQDAIEVLKGAGLVDLVSRIEVLNRANPADLVPSTDEAERNMTQWLKEMAVPQQRTAAPMLVLYGTADTLVDQRWIETAVDRACAMGDSVEWVERIGAGHENVDVTTSLPWVRARFDNLAPFDKCPQGPIRR
jgi:pimeloyl-ACP methyl ester carboxylesterase